MRSGMRILCAALALCLLSCIGCTASAPSIEGTEPTSAEETVTSVRTAAESTTQSESEAESETEAVPAPASVSTDKSRYRVGEAIRLTVEGADGDTVGFYPAAFDVTRHKPIYHATLGANDSIPRGEPVVLTELPGQYRNDRTVAFYYGVLPVGDYKVVLKGADGAIRAEATLEIVYGKNSVDTGIELAARCLDVALNYKTLYVNGCFGAPLTDSNKARYTQNTAYNRRPERQALINAATADTFGFDCVCFIKGILWGWEGDRNHVYGGAAYQSNDVPDITENAMIERSADVTADFSALEVGEAVWIDGHIGIYIGNGLAVECTPSWKDCVQITACNTTRRGYPTREWDKHGRLPYVRYEGERETVK